MTDIAKGLPVRTEDDPDKYVRTRQYDHTDETLGQEVDSDGNAHVEVHGDNPAGGDETLRLSEEGNVNSRGDYDAVTNTKPSSDAVIAHERSATHDETKATKRPTAVDGESDSVCLDISLHDEAGNAYDADNPLPVSFEESEGDEIHDFSESVDVAAGGGTDTHTYSVADGRTFLLKQILADASSRFRYLLEIGDGAATEVFTKKAVRFQSETNAVGGDLKFAEPIKVVGTVNTTTVRITVQNRDDDDAQSIYTTIVGLERNT